MGESRNTDGRFSPEYTDDEILAATRAHEPAATSEVAEEVGMTRQGADRRLRRLRDAGRVSSKKIGASLVWFAPEPDRREPTDAARADAVDDATDAPTDPPGDAHAGHAAAEEDALADVVDTVAAAEGWIETDPDERLAARKAAARAVLEYAAEHGAVSKQDAVEEIHPTHPVESQDARTWYRKTIRPVLNEAAEYDDAARAYRLESASE